MKKIMIIHAEGNLAVNPSLSGIVEILCERGYQVHYYCPRLEGIPQSSSHAGLTYIFIEGGQLRLADRYSFAIGVDRGGIIAAEKVARALRIPCGLISYEIFFAEETGEDFKRPEIAACANVRFAVCQGHERSRQLSMENSIPMDRIIDIPVAGRGVRRAARNHMLHEVIGLPRDTRIALYIGSVVSRWTMVDDLIAGVKDWDDGWVLVLHGRYNDDDMTRFRLRNQQHERIYFTPRGGLPMSAMQSLVQSADMGIAFYRPTFADVHEGRNLEHLGMSSGKIATYLQCGTPIVVNDIGEMSREVAEYQLGIHVQNLDELPSRLRSAGRDTVESWRENCYRYFENKLDLDMRIGPLLDAIESCQVDQPPSGRT
jgi:glycosyltransferase involved in cell wall biosynthesis